MKNNDEKKVYRRGRCDIYEGEGSIIMRLEMPGVNKDGLDISVDGDILSITGRRIQDTVKGDWLVREIRPGDYHMEYTLDETIDRNSIEAKLEKGILTLTLGLSENVKPRKINVVSK